MWELMHRLLAAQLDLGLGKPILLREIVGNGFGLASALLGMRRRVAAWPIGIIGNALLLTVFLGGVFHTPQDRDLWGQAGRQVFFAITSVYGWIQWGRYRRNHGGEGVGVQPRWAGRSGRLQLLIGGILLFVASYLVLRWLGSWGPAADAWILTGSILATYGMAKGWTEFWLIWIAVDAVGVPLLWQAQYYPSAIMYLIYAGFVLWGFFTWWRIQRQTPTSPQAGPGGVELVDSTSATSGPRA